MYLFMSKPNKPSTAGESIFLFISILINMLTLPLAFFIGVMATDSPDSGMKEMILAFLFVQGIPLLLFAGSLFLFISRIRENRKNERSFNRKNGE
ncbi:hypothetical protein D1B33_12060 [Lysinibacillus yapensis]|uniref:Uncharacterized protein n=1 Tax=Ureibacillus yapensis TaxID=2304605 RepID=A0A396S691_9BACL|nr:hypothetical protein D1B33_12060 [Lysinibacillus yapensis]